MSQSFGVLVDELHQLVDELLLVRVTRIVKLND